MPEAPSFRRNLFVLTPMLSGSDVSALQRALVMRGATLDQDGLFGLATGAAVRRFQSMSGLVADGIVGRATWGKLFGSAAAATTGDSRARHCFDFFRARRWSTEQACGLIANIRHESDFQPDRPGDSGLAYGLAQWHPPRQGAFRAKNGRPMLGSTMDEQLDFIDFELRHGLERGAGQRLAAATSARAAGEVVSRFYERPRAVDQEAARRAATAEAFFQTFGPAGQPAVTLAPNDPAMPDRTASDVLAPRQLQTLFEPHRRFPSGVTWALTPDGVQVAGEAAFIRAEDVAAVQAILDRHGSLLASVLSRWAVPVELALAGIGAASAQGAAPRYLLGCDTTSPWRTPDRVTAGLMQTPLAAARRALDQPGLRPADLSDAVDAAIRAGIGLMWLQSADTGFDPPLVAAAYATGALFYDPANRWRLMHERPGASGPIDRFVAMFNAAMRVTATASFPSFVPSFHDLIETASTPTALPTAGTYVAPDPRARIGTSVDTGECVALVQVEAGAPHTTFWRKGATVLNNTAIAPGTAIATFGPNGRYGNRLDGSSHAALYLGQDANGLQVVDQWNNRENGVIVGRRSADERTIHLDRPGALPADRASAFSVIV